MLNKTLNSTFGINVVGHVTGEFGLGEGARGTLRAIEAASIPFVIKDIKEVSQRNLDPTYKKFSENNPYPINLVHANPNPVHIELIGSEYFQGRYNIGFWAWELPIFPHFWQGAFDLFDEIWTYSNYTAEAISKVSPIPVLKIAPSIDLPQPSLDREAFGLPKEKIIFLFMFDFGSIFERKNPLANVEAFKRAFDRANEEVLLVIKFRPHPQFQKQQEQLVRAAEDWPSIRFIEGDLKKEEVHALVNCCDCYVSLHRAEGFGLTMAEAMFYSKPVIATAYSSNVEFMNVGNSFLVKYDLVTTAEDYGPYPKGSVWAQPDIDHAAYLMQYVFNNYQEAQQVGVRAAREIKSLLSPQAVGNTIISRLEHIMKIRIHKQLEQSQVQLPQIDDAEFLQETDSLNDGAFLQLAYHAYLKRELDIGGKETYLQLLHDGKFSRQEFLNNMRNSPEFESLWKQVEEGLLPLAWGVEFISVHIPKTAGITFGNVLEQVWGSEKLVRESNNLSLASTVQKRLISRQTKVIHGHFRVLKYKGCFLHTPLTLIWLRHPITRLISWYCECISRLDDFGEDEFLKYVSQSKPTLLEFAEMPETQNVMSEYVHGMKLSDFYFVGIQEFFRDDLDDLREMLGWPEVKITWNNKNKYPGYHTYVNKVLADKILVAKLADINSADIELYQTALNLRQKRKDTNQTISEIYESQE
jgi:glycosyltransferase involved in cell wall biosynthesis